jgi:hypothetical protein
MILIIINNIIFVEVNQLNVFEYITTNNGQLLSYTFINTSNEGHA